MLKLKESYKSKLDVSFKEVLDCYIYIMCDYFVIINSKLSIQNEMKKQFIIVRGLDTITHVFKYFLYYTKNFKITMEYLEKSIHLYIEFIDQINQAENSFLDFNSRDATQYVYKKTIYELKKGYKHEANNKELERIEYFIHQFKLYLIDNLSNKKVFIKKELIQELDNIMILNI